MSWTEFPSKEFNVKVNNLTKSGHTVFTSPTSTDPGWDGWNIDEVIREHTGSDFGPGWIEL